MLKVIRSPDAGDPAWRQRFLAGARSALRLRHPNIAQLHDAGVDDEGGSAYLVMEHVDGVTIRELVARSGPPGTGLALFIAEQSLRALGYLHRRGYLHCDESRSLRAGSTSFSIPTWRTSRNPR